MFRNTKLAFTLSDIIQNRQFIIQPPNYTFFFKSALLFKIFSKKIATTDISMVKLLVAMHMKMYLIFKYICINQNPML